ncbi:hypothetical protein GCM10023085_56010 [Actinomadura viridis]
MIIGEQFLQMKELACPLDHAHAAFAPCTAAAFPLSDAPTVPLGAAGDAAEAGRREHRLPVPRRKHRIVTVPKQMTLCKII